ncbi:MAG TPA: efflux RND transporter periplasmic adaptor subunit [Kofleriaceae bacterium]|nr:efflux RND transporter periplasmic adaptor subunit [Kofleriaceae bacterium]
MKVIQKDVPLQSEWIATLDGFVNADIKPQVNGYLIKQSYTEGMQVRKGDVLFEIDPRTFRAALDQAGAQVDQSDAQLGRARQDLERDRPLADARAIARSQLDNDVQSERAARAATDSARASRRQAQLNLEFTKVRSLVDGIAGLARGQIGDLVGPTTVLTTVSQVDPIKAYVSISEQEYMRFAEAMAPGGQLLPGSPDGEGGGGLQLILGDGNVYPYKGQFVLADRQVDPTTGTIRVLATFPNPRHLLRPGQFGRVRATTRVARGALLVPQRAVTELQGNYQVAVVGPDKKAMVRPVELGEQVGSMWIVEKGVSAGDSVVAEGVQKVKDGAPVNPKPVQADSVPDQASATHKGG